MTPPAESGLLSDLRVLDFSRVMSGPYCTAMLADLGAEVVKVETPERGDDSRHFGPFVDGESVYFALLNRNKRSITLDLKRPEAREIALQLAERCDIVVENFRPGVAQRLGIGYADVAARNPRAIYLSVSGFGQDGPMRDWPAYDLVIQAMGGLMSITGEPDGLPMAVGDSIADVSTGLFGAWALMAALHARSRDGRGRHIDLAMMDSVFSLLVTRLSQWVGQGTVPGRVGNRHPVTAPVDAYRASDGLFVMVVPSDGLFAALCRTIGEPALVDDRRFATNAGRQANQAALKQRIEAWAATRSVADATGILRQAGIPAGPVWDVSQAAGSEHARSREMLQQVAHPRFGDIAMMTQPARFTDAPRRPPRPEPGLGADSDTVLAGWLGLDSDAIAALRAAGVI